jgi:hypothetical protein
MNGLGGPGKLKQQPWIKKPLTNGMSCYMLRLFQNFSFGTAALDLCQQFLCGGFSMTIRFFIGLLLTAVVLIVTGWICGLSAHPLIFFDVPSIVLAILFPLFFQGIMHGWEDVISAFSAPFNDAIDKDALLRAKLFFENY